MYNLSSDIANRICLDLLVTRNLLKEIDKNELSTENVKHDKQVIINGEPIKNKSIKRKGIFQIKKTLILILTMVFMTSLVLISLQMCGKENDTANRVQKKHSETNSVEEILRFEGLNTNQEYEIVASLYFADKPESKIENTLKFKPNKSDGFFYQDVTTIPDGNSKVKRN